MLNPQRWGGNAQNGYSSNLASNYRNGQILYELDDDDDDFAPKQKQATLSAAREREHPLLAAVMSLELIV
jgi:hypothetical protein